MAKLAGSYCPLCGEIGLQTKKQGGKLWAYCPNGDGVAGPKDAHTAYVIDDGGSPPSQPKPEEQKPDQEKET